MNAVQDFSKIKGQKISTDPALLSNHFPYVNDQAAHDRAESLMRKAEALYAEARYKEKGYESDEVDALLQEALEHEIKAIEFTGHDEMDFDQAEAALSLFGYPHNENNNGFEKHSQQRLMDMLDEMVREAEDQASSANANSEMNTGFTGRSGTDKTQNAEKATQRAEQARENSHKLKLMMLYVHNVNDLQEKLQAD